MLKSREDVERVGEQAEKGLNRQKVRAMVCAGTGCLANGSLKVYEKLRELVSEKGLLVDLDMTEDACGEAHSQRRLCSDAPCIWHRKEAWMPRFLPDGSPCPH
jgi:NADH:ubiquinone oxidoreductase subunit E